MPLQLNDRNASVRQWRHVMNARFGGLYTRLHGPLPEDTDLFGPRAVEWQKEYEFRTSQPQDGKVSGADLAALKIPVPAQHTVITINGFMGDMWTGYPAICGQALEAVGCYWQPVGWTNTDLPMTENIKGGVEATIEQINHHLGTFMLVPYSEGDVVATEVLDEIRNGSLQHREKDLIAASAFGPPRREEGARPPGCPDPGGHGIARDRVVDTPDFWWDYADPGDMYACTPDGQVGEFITSCYQAIAKTNIVGGSGTLAKEMVKLLTNPSGNVIPLGAAIFKALTFFGSGVAAHVHYHDREIIPGVTYLDHAIGHLKERAAAVTPRAA